MDLDKLEIELKKRLALPYQWGQMQNDAFDKKSNFIYTTFYFDKLLQKLEFVDADLKNYALNRWYNFWSAKAVEHIFTSHPNVIANKNSRDKLIDFKINAIPFDHKTSKFPKGFKHSIDYATKNEKQLIQWFYANQSQEGRKHLKNRLFIVVYDRKNKAHWKIKAEIRLLKAAIDKYIVNFSEKNLNTFDFGYGEIYSDIIWVSNETKLKKNIFLEK